MSLPEYMTESLEDRKKALRAAMARARGTIEPGERARLSGLICRRVMGVPAAREAATWFVYVSFRSEVETPGLLRELLGRGRRVAVPCIDRAARTMSASLVTSLAEDLAPGFFGVPEPAPGRLRPIGPGDIDVVIVPGLAFGENGFRVGYGGGFYDRFLKGCPALTIGLAFDVQLLPDVPHDRERDVPLDYIATESRLIACRAAGATPA